ncbi:hypothetical protein SAMN00120144_0304 [Hymenobacter roseosalivarius DSM 11622]|uniref:Uncharacterized protein n=1 Tax=Hymenobacter roseosalivarius DSM 11622 TaxID=645990 RepID=A0A1W1VUW2_9BACT|nr:hypothetical protein [Hymenobacter roseosalivarius]SMB97149.1 hypothetical protein SAMN00120144_0304 [Hymenobacter roseosalivarius DSM 11622]
MTDQEKSDWVDRQLQAGLVAAYAAMLNFKRYKKTPVIVSRNGQILEVHPDKMPPATQEN